MPSLYIIAILVNVHIRGLQWRHVVIDFHFGIFVFGILVFFLNRLLFLLFLNFWFRFGLVFNGQVSCLNVLCKLISTFSSFLIIAAVNTGFSVFGSWVWAANFSLRAVILSLMVFTALTSSSAGMKLYRSSYS